MASNKKKQPDKTIQEKKTVADTSDKISFSPASIRQFIQEVQAEFNKIVWPERKVTVGLTGFVLLLVVVLAIYLGSVDMILGKLVTLVLR